jgi:carbonic anhydrase
MVGFWLDFTVSLFENSSRLLPGSSLRLSGGFCPPSSTHFDTAHPALSSSRHRQEIVSLRQSTANSTAPIPPPKISDPGFRALVEENVKHTVRTIVEDSVVVNIYHELAALADGENACTASDEGGKEQCHKARKRSGEVKEVKNVFVHGLVYGECFCEEGWSRSVPKCAGLTPGCGMVPVDIETGTITDLGVSVGPPGVEVPTYGSLL